MNILFTVCGRAGSKGIKGKNFKEFLGHPLLFYTFAAIVLYRKRHSNFKIDIALNTDSQEMIDMIKDNAKINAFIVQRKLDMAGDHVAKKVVIADTMNEVQKQNGIKYDLIVDCDITSPLRTVEDIEKLVDKASNNEYDVVFSVVDARRNPFFNMVKENQDDTVSLVIDGQYTARQQAPAVYDMNASLYAFKPAFLNDKKMLLHGKCGMVKMMDTAVLDLDYENDFELMQVIADYLINKKHYAKIRDIFDVAGELQNNKQKT